VDDFWGGGIDRGRGGGKMLIDTESQYHELSGLGATLPPWDAPLPFARHRPGNVSLSAEVECHACCCSTQAGVHPD
jgi:hypothetical protein